ncbi:MBL fold metallo-hydrolase [Mucilaginibacter conchicola]|uniref:MBL fold metallo-hydrolase n=1 Tax=Mucilaginibacter conchicola TaxID=2303333 RepID=A0A372NQP4_9SPHI|nr:MBL fold metallo-hydrolase [Mucilaginibacter conchicola]RFZ90970.1 MBL fold metallo-hydrolase [Mucilaginibacter conchicola]
MKHKLLLKARVLVALLFTFPIGFTAKAQTTDAKLLDQPGYYKMQVGDVEVIALSDGTIPLDMGKLLFNEKPETIEKLFKDNFQTTMAESSTNVYLVRTGNKLVLIDAGAGQLLGPTLGKLVNNLAKVGYKPEQIDAILITHFHVDHVGGLMQDGKLTFPNATIYAGQRDIDYWLSEENAKKAPADAKWLFDGAQKSVSPSLKAGKTKALKAGETLFSVIKPLATPGHTPGHTSYILESKGQKMIFLGDIVHAVAVQFAKPAVTIHFDVDSPQAYAQRVKVFNAAASGKYWVAGAHLPFPGTGHIRAEKDHYIWIPANYSTIAQ